MKFEHRLPITAEEMQDCIMAAGEIPAEEWTEMFDTFVTIIMGDNELLAEIEEAGKASMTDDERRTLTEAEKEDYINQYVRDAWRCNVNWNMYRWIKKRIEH